MVTPLPRPVFPARMAAHGSMGARRERDRDARGVRDAGFLRGTRRQPERRVRGTPPGADQGDAVLPERLGQGPGQRLVQRRRSP